MRREAFFPNRANCVSALLYFPACPLHKLESSQVTRTAPRFHTCLFLCDHYPGQKSRLHHLGMFLSCSILQGSANSPSSPQTAFHLHTCIIRGGSLLCLALKTRYSFLWLWWVLIAAHKIFDSLRLVGLGSLTRNQTEAPCIGSLESQLLDHQGSPRAWLFRSTCFGDSSTSLST